ncbi:hypothetical protein C8Q72DRAFT_126103 [Fomitopsis betulina]|nr:hypothetical protein C8Q72DRAFT_126103 [Fomitopsis betulina]
MANSTSQAQEEQAYIAVVESNFTTNLCLFSAVALYCFDFTLTFAQQVRFLRGRRFSFPTLLFLLLHITGCLTLVATPAAMFAPPCEVRIL